MLMGEAAARSGVPAKTLRYSEDIGRIAAPKSESELDRLVERARGLDPADCDPHWVCHLIGPS